MATRFRRHRTRRSKGRKGLKTRKMRGGLTNPFSGLFRSKSPLSSEGTETTTGVVLNKNELVENARDLMRNYEFSFRDALRKGMNESQAQQTRGVKSAYNALIKKIENLRKIDPEHELVKTYNNYKSGK